MTENRCPLIENCQQKSAVCNVMLPDESCYWFRWFRSLDNPWHTGTPTEEGWYLVKVNYDEHLYFAMKFENGSFWDYDDNDPHFVKIIPDFISMWKKIDGEKEDGHTD